MCRVTPLSRRSDTRRVVARTSWARESSTSTFHVESAEGDASVLKFNSWLRLATCRSRMDCAPFKLILRISSVRRERQSFLVFRASFGLPSTRTL
jgi:hypothetical protein